MARLHCMLRFLFAEKCDRTPHAELKMLNPPSDVSATKLPAFAPQATSFAGTAFRTGSDQLFDALVYC